MSQDRFEQLTRWAADVRGGAMPVEDFAAALAAAAEAVALQKARIEAVEMPPEAGDLLGEELEAARAGVELFGQGVARMLRYADDPDPRHLDEGLRAARDGHDEMLRAVLINRQTRERLEREYREGRFEA